MNNDGADRMTNHDYMLVLTVTYLLNIKGHNNWFNPKM